MSEPRVAVQVADHVATVTLSRPDKHNALDGAMFEGILAAAAQVASTPGVRVVVLHGAGPSFCSGLDIASLMTGAGGGKSLDDVLRREEGQRANDVQRVCTDWLDLDVPVIAAIHGNCFGGGLQIALGADIRFVAPDAKMSVMEVHWGLVPDMGITSTLPRLVRADVARELTYTARRVSGTEAVELGLATHVADDPLTAATALAREIAGRSPDAVRGAKRLYREADALTDAEALVLETGIQRTLIGSANQMAAVTAGMTREPGVFTDPAV